MQPADITYIIFLFLLGSCIGSFLNVVVWRLPRNESLVSPPSHCPRCNHLLAWYDNIPVLGWIFLRGRCRYCAAPISPRYPIIEFITGLLFVFYYVLFFIEQKGPRTEFDRFLTIGQDWPMYFLYIILICGLLASSLIDAEQFIIPSEIPWTIAGIGIIAHAVFDKPGRPWALNLTPTPAALALGTFIGLLISLWLWKKKWIGQSFPDGEPMLDIDREAYEQAVKEAQEKGEEVPPMPPVYTKAQVRAEMRHEILFLLPPLLMGCLCMILASRVPTIHKFWFSFVAYHYWFSGMLGAILGALAAGFVVWFTRICGTMGFGRVAMGLGDVDLMLAVGAVMGAGPAVLAFFLAPFFGVLVAIYLLLTGTRREIPYGPYLSLASAAVMVMYEPFAQRIRPGLEGMCQMAQQILGL